MTMVFALWTLIGLLVDAYFHSTDPGLESFWTPWHALFYSGFTATAVWIGYVTAKRARPGKNILQWAPVGYRLALIGVGVFAVGGVGDAIWHTIFGVETSLDALLSPTHLLLFVGLLLIVSSPLRAAWSDSVVEPSLAQFAPTLLSLTITTTIVAFFFQYCWAVTEIWIMQTPYDPNDNFSETLGALAVLGIIVSTVIMFTPLLVSARRWRLPVGTATLLLLAVNVFVVAGFDEESTTIPAVILGGLAFDFLVKVEADRRLLAAVPPVILWIFYFVLVDRSRYGLGLAPEIWGGAIVFAGLTMLAIDLLMRVDAGAPSPTTSPVGANVESPARVDS